MLNTAVEKTIIRVDVLTGRLLDECIVNNNMCARKVVAINDIYIIYIDIETNERFLAMAYSDNEEEEERFDAFSDHMADMQLTLLSSLIYDHMKKLIRKKYTIIEM